MNANEIRLGFVALARPTFDTKLAAQAAATARQQLEQAGFSLVGPAGLMMDATAAKAAAQELAAARPDLLVIVQASFADSSMAMRLAQAVPAPPVLWAVPEAGTGGRLRLNSMCGINLAGHALTRAGLRYDYVYAAPDDPAALEEIGVLAQAGRVKRLLGKTRVGRIGENPLGFESCLVDNAGLKGRFGLEVVQVALPDVFEGVRNAPAAAVDEVLAALRPRLDGLDEVDQAALRGTLGTYKTLQGLANSDNLQGLAVRCWPEFFTELGCAACGAMSMLSDELTPCSCEADVNGTIAQLMLQWLSGGPAFGTDMVSVDAERDGIVLWHCGLAPLDMADPESRPRATIHSNRQLPLLMEFTLKPGPVTIARLSEATGEFRLVVGRGEMLRAPAHFSGTSGVLRFDRPARDVLDTILREGLEHHISLTYGDHVPALLALAGMLDLPVLQL